MAKILCTGGAGFIGSHLVDRLLSEGHKVTVWDNFSTGVPENVQVHDNCILPRFIDVTEMHTMLHSLSAHVYPYDYVFHLAAQINLRHSIQDPIDDAETNIIGTLNVLKAIKKHSPNCKFIFTSTGGAIYDPQEPLPWVEHSKTVPESPYGLAKLSAEGYIRLTWDNHTILRLSNVYGPRQNPHGEAGVIAIFLDNMLKDKSIKVFGDGLQTRDFVYVDDVVDALMLTIDNPMKGIFNVSSGDRINVNQIAKLLFRLTKKDTEKLENHPAIEGELRHSGLSHHKISGCFGWRPKTVLYDGLKKTVKHYV